jgi:23S rRNA (uracil1939-C5)-methyltransferase
MTMNETEITIHDVAFGGDGVGRLPDGKVVFVPYTLKDEVVRVRLHKARKGFSQAELVQVILPSPNRTAPPCPYFGRCGGCQYQHATYEEQLRIKQKQVQDVLQRIGKFRELPEIHIETAPQSYGYRNKISVHSGDRGELGFYANDNQTVIDVERCVIANENVNARLQALRKASFKPRHVSLTDETQRSDSAEGSFHQVNTSMAAKLLEWVHSRIGQKSDSQLLDLYCGSGFFTLGLADLFGTTCGVERDQRGIHTATLNAKASGITNARFFATDVDERIDWLLDEGSGQALTILADPPREGLPSRVVESIARKMSGCFIYVSCNPATLARDLKRFVEMTGDRYVFRDLGVFDMFPQTAHIETVAVLQLKK